MKLFFSVGTNKVQFYYYLQLLSILSVFFLDLEYGTGSTIHESQQLALYKYFWYNNRKDKKLEFRIIN